MAERSNQATVYEIAQRAGVSIATVSRVVNNAEGIRPSTRERVLQAIDELAYVPNGLAQGMARRSTGVLGLVYRYRDWAVLARAEDGQSDPRADLTERAQHSLTFYDHLIRGVEDAAYRCDRMVLLRGARTNAETPAILSMTGKCDGLVLMDRVLPDADMAKITRQVPVASIAHRVDAPGVTNIVIDNHAAMVALVTHMIEVHGARRFAFLGGPYDSTDSQVRAEATVACIESHGLECAPLEDWHGDYTPSTAFDLVIRNKDCLPEVIVAANDGSAMGAIAGLNALGLRVPEDVAVTGFDDMELAELHVPPLTTIRQPVEQMARIAVEAVAGAARAGAAGAAALPPRDHVVSAQLVVRGSCGCQADPRAPGPPE